MTTCKTIIIVVLILLAAVIIYGTFFMNGPLSMKYSDQTGNTQVGPTVTVPPIFNVTSGVNNLSYDSHWGEMMNQYGDSVFFSTIGGYRTFFGLYFDLAANSAQRPEDRPGLLVSGGQWIQNQNRIIVTYSSQYMMPIDKLNNLQTGNVTSYDHENIYVCLDPACQNLLNTNTNHVYNLQTFNYSFLSNSTEK